MDKKHVKILFRFYSDLYEEEMVETVWAIELDVQKGYYQIDNIPFFIPNLASNDVVKAVFDNNEDYLVYQETIQYSTNSNIRVIVIDKSLDINKIMMDFNAMSCNTEGYNDIYFVMEIEKGVDYQPIKTKLVELEKKGSISFAEAVLSDYHK